MTSKRSPSNVSLRTTINRVAGWREGWPRMPGRFAKKASIGITESGGGFSVSGTHGPG